jgi:uncharacterized membrane protein YhaH (DUF805 family)
MNGYLSAMRRYFEFSGRSSRSEFWFFILFLFILSIVASVLDAMLFGDAGVGGVALLSSIVSIVHFIPSLSVSVRRLHDIDRSGWWILLGLVPLLIGAVLFGGSLFMMAGATDPTLGTMGGIAGMGLSVFVVIILEIVALIILIVFYCTRGTPGPNRFGPPQVA